MGCATFKSRSLPGYLISGEVERGRLCGRPGVRTWLDAPRTGLSSGPASPVIGPRKRPRRYTGSFFQPSIVLVCGDAGSPGSGDAWCDRVLLRAMAYPFLVASLACPTSRHGRLGRGRPSTGERRSLAVPVCCCCPWATGLGGSTNGSPKHHFPLIFLPNHGSSVPTDLSANSTAKIGMENTGHVRTDDITSAHPWTLTHSQVQTT